MWVVFYVILGMAMFIGAVSSLLFLAVLWGLIQLLFM